MECLAYLFFLSSRAMRERMTDRRRHKIELAPLGLAALGLAALGLAALGLADLGLAALGLASLGLRARPGDEWSQRYLGRCYRSPNCQLVGPFPPRTQ